MAKEFKNLQMVIFIKACMSMANLMDMANIIGRMGAISKVNLKMV